MRRLLCCSLVSLIGCATHDASHEDGAASSVGDGGATSTVDASPDLVPAVPPLGANVESGGVVFRVWAPDAKTAQVSGSFASSPAAMELNADGVFEAHVPGAKAGDRYQFVLDGKRTRTDPWCRQLDGADCDVVDPAAYAWKSTSWERPARNASVVYEMHVGSFAVDAGATNGTFTSVAAALDPLADLGVNVIELMPIQSSGSGPDTWGYNPQLYFAPKPGYGNADELRALVDRAHTVGIAVWMDSVYNHTDSWTQAPLYCFDEACASGNAGIYFFPPGTYATTPWGPRPNYADPQVATMLLGAVSTWIEEMHGDGFRWDSVSNIRSLDGTGTVPGGKDLLVAINARAHASGVVSVAEDLKGDDAITAAASGGGFGFDAQWDAFGYDVVGELIKTTDASRDLGNIEGALTLAPNGDPWSRLLYTESHDTVGNSGTRLPNQIDAANPTSLDARKRSMLGALLLMTTPGVPMIFMGQEQLALGNFANPPPPLPAATTQGLFVRAFYKDLIGLRRNLAGKSGGLTDASIDVFHRNDTAKVLGYRRYGTSGQDVVVVVNLANKAYTEYDVGVDSAGPWTVRLNLDSTQYSADFPAGQTGMITAKAGAKDGKAYTLPLQLGAYSAMILSK